MKKILAFFGTALLIALNLVQNKWIVKVHSTAHEVPISQLESHALDNCIHGGSCTAK